MQDITTGTEKQNKWAEDIRLDLLKTLEEQLAEFKAHPRCPEQYQDSTLEEWLAMDGPTQAQLRRILEVANHRFWIDIVRGQTGARYRLQDLMVDPRLVEYV